MKNFKIKQWIVPMIMGLFMLTATGAQAQVVELVFTLQDSTDMAEKDSVGYRRAASYEVDYGSSDRVAVFNTGEYFRINSWTQNNAVCTGLGMGKQSLAVQANTGYLYLNSTTTASKIVIHWNSNNDTEDFFNLFSYGAKASYSNSSAPAGHTTILNNTSKYAVPLIGNDGNSLIQYVGAYPGYSPKGNCFATIISGINVPAGGTFVMKGARSGGERISKIEIVPVGTLVDITGINVKPLTKDVILNGEPVILEAIPTPYAGSYKWVVTEGNTNATVDENTGLITTLGLGQVKVQAVGTGASSSAIYDEITFEVKALTPAESVEITGIPNDYDGTAAKGVVGSTYNLGATLLPANTTYKGVSFKIADAGTAAVSIDKDGKNLKATTAGTVVVNAVVDSTNTIFADSTIVFANKLVTAIDITNAPPSDLTIGDNVNLGATITPSDATDRSVTWSVSEGTAVSVDGTGKVTAVMGGVAKVRATANDGSGIFGEVTITVLAGTIRPTGISLSGGVTELNVGETAATPFVATANPVGAAGDVEFSVVWSDEGRATISSDGKLTGVKAGSVVVSATVTYDGSTYRAYAPVNIKKTESALVGAGSVTMEGLIVYENFGSANTISSEKDVTPGVWPEVNGGENAYAGWETKSEKFLIGTDAAAEMVSVPKNNAFGLDSIKVGLGGNLPAGIGEAAGAWYKSIPLLNGAVTSGVAANTSANLSVYGGAAFPSLQTGLSYTSAAPWWQSKDRADELGFLFLNKTDANTGVPSTPVITLPGEDGVFLNNLTKLEFIASGTRGPSQHYNTLVVRINTYDANEGVVLTRDTFTYALTATPRRIKIDVPNGDNAIVYIEGRGSGNNNNYTDFLTKNSQSELDGPSGYNLTAVTGNTKGNPGVALHMMKIYGKVQGAGHTITATAEVTGKTTGIAYGESVELTAAATKSGNNFVGWRISGRPDLSEVENPLNIVVTENMSITPLYVGDKAELPVVNENFRNWQQHGALVTDATQRANGLLDFSSGTPKATVVDKTVKVPLRYGFTSGGDSVDITLKGCNVMPSNTVRVHNVPGADKWYGYVAFMGPNADKGYVDVASLTGLTKVEMDISAYDMPNPARAVAAAVNGAMVRNMSIMSFYAEKLEIPADPTKAFNLRVGYGNQARAEFFGGATPSTVDPKNDYMKSTLSAAAGALHNLKMYAEVTLPAGAAFYKLTVQTEGEGRVSIAPTADNSSNSFMSGETVSLRAIPGTGYGLDRWVDGSGTDLGSTEVINVTMDQAKTIKAVFSVDPSYVNVTVVGKGELTFSETPTDIEDNKYTFVAGVPLTITATPEYGFIAKKENWKIDNVDKVGTQFSTLVSTYLLAGTDLVKNQTLNLQFTFDSITDRVTVAILTDTIKGKFTFSPEGENLRFVEAGDLDTILVDFPKDVSIKMTAVPGYSYSYSTNKEHTNGNTALDIGSDVKMDKNYVIEPTWARLTYKQVIINNDDPDGRLEIDDPNQDYSSYEEEDKYPVNYKVRIRIDANQGFQLASITGPSWELSDEDGYILVTIPSDTTTIVYVTPEFAEIVEGVQLLVNQNFQSGTLWPENEGTVSNVPGAISYLGLSSTWDPRTLSIDEILKAMVKYRAEGSLYDYNEGPSVGGKPYPPSSLDLVYKASPLTRKIPANVQAAGRSDSLTFTLANYAPCNDCLNYKAVKEENLGMKWLGRITPGTIALKSVTSSVNEKRSALGSDAQPFMSGDTVGVMIVDGFAYVEKVEVGFASGTGGFCPSVYYNIDGGASVDEQGRFQGDLSSMTIIGYDRALRQKRPDRGEYGWGSAQEGMVMDQNMYVSESDVDQTQIVILPGYEVVEVSEEEKYYKYTQMFIHDLKIWGSAKQIETPNPPDPTGVASEKDANNKFYMLGSTNVLKVDVPNAKTLVIYNEMGTAIKVIRGVDIETVELPDLKQGVYFVHCYNTKGERVSGSFIKINN